MRRLLVLLGALSLASSAGSAEASEPPGLRLVEQRQIDARLSELTFRTPALNGPTGVRVLLPRGYRSSHRRYPVLYLLHGCCNGQVGYRTWTERLETEEITDGRPLIVVMPDSGPTGGYVDWWNFGAGGAPAWETYHLRQLVPFVDRRYRTIARRSGRAVAGISMGGGGALGYAARHPDMFVAAAAYSGAVDLNIITPALNAIGSRDDRPLGSYETQQIRSRAVNAWDLAENLRGMRLRLSTGDGTTADGRLVDLVEATVRAANSSLHARLQRLGIPHIWDDYGPGTHSAPWWIRDLRQNLPEIMRAFRRPPRPPARVSFKSAQPRYEVYGWQVRLERRVLEFSRLVDARRRGFTLIGSGRAVVRTPPLYEPRSRRRVTIRGERRTLRADARGRLRMTFALGPANRLQQFTPEERASPSRFFRTVVRVR
jgi:S-formylglutathione hydrolase FrmB